MATGVSNETKTSFFTITEGEATHQSSPRQGALSELQPIDEFLKEQEEVNEQLAATKALQNLQQTQKKAKSMRFLDPELKAAEEDAVEEIGSTNWIGKLVEYRQANPVPGDGFEFTESGNDDAYLPRFTCSVTIREAAEQEFGGNVSFAVKKTAKRYAAKKAIDWLIEHNRMPSNGSVRFPKPKPPPQQLSPRMTRSASAASSSASERSDSSTPEIPYTSQVPPLCHKLGIPIPRYEITQENHGSPMCNIYADFNGDPLIMGKVGEVKNVYGRKNAKQECARLVIAFLKDVERQRLAEFNDEDQSRKRPLSSGEENGAKAVKVNV